MWQGEYRVWKWVSQANLSYQSLISLFFSLPTEFLFTLTSPEVMMNTLSAAHPADQFLLKAPVLQQEMVLWRLKGSLFCLLDNQHLSHRIIHVIDKLVRVERIILSCRRVPLLLLSPTTRWTRIYTSRGSSWKVAHSNLIFLYTISCTFMDSSLSNKNHASLLMNYTNLLK